MKMSSVQVGVLLFIFALDLIQGDRHMCDSPSTIQNGFQRPKDQRPYHEHETIHFFCNEGYSLTGPPKIMCENGKWSSKAPVCKDPCDNQCMNNGKCTKREDARGTSSYYCACPTGHAGQFCELDVCNNPLQLPNGEGKVTGGHCGTYCSDRTTIEYKCNEGYRIHGYANLRCTGGVWSYAKPRCQVITCKNNLNPPRYSILNGEYSPKKERYQYGEEVSFQCIRGYALVGKPTVRCENTGFWSSYSWPRCHRQQCPAIVGIKYGNVIWEKDSRAVGTKVRYSCSRGHYLYGQSEQTCIVNVNGEAFWSGRQPMCISRGLFEQYCAVLGKIMVVIPEPRCEAEANTKTVVRTTSMDTMTIVTGTAGGILGFLLVVIAIVACQRRRLVRRMRLATSRPGRSWSTEEDRMAFICYSNDVRFFLPSYDEAMRTRPPEPPPFEAVAGSNSRRETRAGSASTTTTAPAPPPPPTAQPTPQESTESDEHAYETIDALPANTRLNTNQNEPIYAAVQRVLSPFARTMSRLSSSGSQGETATAVEGSASSTTESTTESVSLDEAAAGPVFEASGSLPSDEPTPSSSTQGHGAAASKPHKKGKKGKKHKAAKANSWQLSVTKSEDSESQGDSSSNVEASAQQLHNSSESLEDGDESKPLISN